MWLFRAWGARTLEPTPMQREPRLAGPEFATANTETVQGGTHLKLQVSKGDIPAAERPFHHQIY